MKETLPNELESLCAALDSRLKSLKEQQYRLLKQSAVNAQLLIGFESRIVAIEQRLVSVLPPDQMTALMKDIQRNQRAMEALAVHLNSLSQILATK